MHKVQTQGAINCGDKSKGKDPAFTPASASIDSEPSNKARKDKKKKQHRDKKNSKEPKDSTTPASKVNAVEIGGKGRRRNKKNVN